MIAATTLAQAVPEKVRHFIYSVLAVLIPLEALVDVIPSDAERVVMLLIGLLGFGMAASNTGTVEGDA